MRFHWIFGALLASLLLPLTACEDPSNVGIGLVGEQGGEPFIVEVPTSAFSGEDTRDLTGNTTRFLAGTVVDPLLGTTTATGYVDFFADPSDDFKASTVDTVVLRLRRDYVYGDTTATFQLTLRSMGADWSSQNVPADTTLEAGAVILEAFSFAAADTLINVPLPADWVAQNESVFRSDDFLTDFNGFQLTAAATSGNAVLGFSRAGSTLLATTASEDTTIYSTTKNLSTYAQGDDGLGLPPDVQLIRDGTGPTGRLMFDFTGEAVQQQSLNRVVVRLAENDALLAANTPPNFFRPPLATFNLTGVDETDDTSALLVPSATMNAEGVLNFESADLRTIVQRLIFGEAPVTHFTLEPPTSDNTINVLLVKLQPTDEAPAARLTLTPTEN